jgi:light-regulated signal transduction histidine kinase (bacteriophytochrome)
VSINQHLINKYDSEFCGSLPIHLINVIQPYGALIVINRDTKEILQVSENLTGLVGRSFTELPGTLLSDYVTRLSFEESKRNTPQLCEIKGKPFLGILHGKEEYYLLEINLTSGEEALQSTFIDLYKELRNTMAAIESQETIEAALKISARELKNASGFDKVMIYCFDEHWNGHVMAEEKEENMEAYIGFTFPASDIPKQARELYLKNSYRFIPDRDYQAVKLFPVINPLTQTFVDMSDCNVRGVSSVHIEYLRNMNVAASMSTRIIKDGKLWGLIACHHKSPKKVNYGLCAVFELLSGIISAKISTVENRSKRWLDNELSEIYTSLVEETYRTRSVPGGLLSDNNQSIIDLFNAGGAVIIHQGQSFKKGRVPDEDDLEDILMWLNTKHADSIYTTNSLGNEFDYASEFREIASGLMAIPINVDRDEYVLVFRPELVQVINWGGDPSTRINFEADMKTYHPRFSFKLWQQNVSGTSMPWKKEEIEMAESLREFIREFLNNSY